MLVLSTLMQGGSAKGIACPDLVYDVTNDVYGQSASTVNGKYGEIVDAVVRLVQADPPPPPLDPEMKPCGDRNDQGPVVVAGLVPASANEVTYHAHAAFGARIP